MRTLETAHFRIEKLEKELALKESQLTASQKSKEQKKKKEEKVVELLCRFYQEKFGKNPSENEEVVKELNIEKLREKEIKDWKSWELQLFVEAVLNHLKNYMGSYNFDSEIWKKAADSRIAKFVPSNKENVVQEELKVQKKCDSDYIRSLSL